MNRPQVLKVLAGVRERRGRPLERAVQAALQREDEAQAVVQAAQHSLVGALAAETQERGKLSSLTDAGQTFDIGMLLLREHVAGTMKEKVVQQQSEVERCDTALAQCTQDVRVRRGALARNRQKVESLHADLKAWHAARQQEQDDLQDEEAEETASGRMFQAAPGSGAPAGVR